MYKVRISKSNRHDVKKVAVMMK